MNGRELERVKAMDSATFQGYLAAKVEGNSKQLEVIGKNQGRIFGSINDIQIKIAELPKHCLHEDDFQKMCRCKEELEGRIDALEKEETGRKAVKTLLLGAGGGGGVIGVLFLIAKYVLNLF